ncbi:MAG TPA: MerR family DNA-binding protein, partial [Micromonosporaceae bacterium]|nr:MerR family DNA-binding protein [Micromonosporaceae bacterium]
LLAKPVRSPAGYRSYPPETVDRVRFIKRAQELGFSLHEVETLLHLAGGGPDGCDSVRTLAVDKVADLERRIADLRALHSGLTRLVATCDRPRAERDCPILAELDHPTGSIELLLAPGCPHADGARNLLSRCLDRLGLDVPVLERTGDYPSPTVLVDGVDVMTQARGRRTMQACRLDLPTAERIETALRERGGGANPV